MSHPPTILVDTNTIIESYEIGCWKALSGALHLETVDAVIKETQDGYTSRPVDQRIDEVALRASLRATHPVTDEQLAAVALAGGASLGAGEKALWAHALTRADAWILCGPDRASMRFGCENACKDRLVSLESLLKQIKFTPRTKLRPHFEQAWLVDVRTKVILGIL